MRNRYVILISIIVGATAFAGGILYNKNNPQEIDTSSYGEVREDSGDFSFINPLLECSLGPEYLTRGQVRPSREKIDSLISEEKKRGNITFASVYYRDLNNGPWLGINEKEKFFPASLMKIPLAIYFYKKSENDQTIFNNIIKPDKFPEEIELVQYYKPEKEVDTTKNHTVKELLESMIIYSDNHAAEGLVYSMEPDGFSNLLKNLHLDMPRDENDYITVRDYATFFRILFNSSYLNQDNSESLLKLLSETSFDKAMTKYLPKDTRVSHKFGEKTSEFSNDKQLHDCGIVYVPLHPYLICIMTRGNNFDNLADSIGKISKLVYDEVLSQK